MHLVRSGHSLPAPVLSASHPRNDHPVAEPQDQIHHHGDTPADPSYNPHHILLITTAIHAIDHDHDAVLGPERGFQPHRSRQVPSPYGEPLVFGPDQPTSVFRGADQRRKTGCAIKSWKTQPVNRTVPSYQRDRGIVANNGVVLDELRHALILRKLKHYFDVVRVAF